MIDGRRLHPAGPSDGAASSDGFTPAAAGTLDNHIMSIDESSNTIGVKRLRLLNVMLQPLFVVGDAATLTAHLGGPVLVPPVEWLHSATGKFTEGFEGLRRQLADSSSVGLVTSSLFGA